MKTSPKSSPRTAPAQRTFTWAVRAVDISFMDTQDDEAVSDGCEACNGCACDCGCGIAKFDKARAEVRRQDEGQ